MHLPTASYSLREYKSAEFKILTWCPAWGAPDFERRGAARSGFWGLPRGIVQILSTILASTALLAPHSAIAPQRGTPAHHSEFLGSPGKFARTSPTGSNGRDGPAAADRRTWQTPHDYDQEVRDRFAKYVEQERRAEAAGFLPPSGTGSNVYTRGAADVDHDEEAELRRLESGAETSSASIPDPARPDAAAPLPQAPSEQQQSPPAA